MRVSRSIPAVRAPRIMLAALAALAAAAWLAAAGTAHAALQFELAQCRHNGTVADPAGCAGAAWQNCNLTPSMRTTARATRSVPRGDHRRPLGSHTLEIG